MHSLLHDVNWVAVFLRQVYVVTLNKQQQHEIEWQLINRKPCR